MGYLDGVRSELEKVSWPTNAEVIRLFQIVIGVTIIASLVLASRMNMRELVAMVVVVVVGRVYWMATKRAPRG